MKYRKKILSNGLRIITVPMKESQTAIMMVLVEAGSEYEDKKINGLSHFLEHVCFKGTKNRTGPEIVYELDSLGADNNAFTSEECTGYWAKARMGDVGKLIDIISDMYINPIFPEKDIDIERGVILQEINMYEDMPIRKVWVVHTELLFGDQPAGRSILGPAENIKTLKRDDFVKYYKSRYIPQNTAVVVAGNINENKVAKLVEEKFGSLKKGKIIKKPKVIFNQKSPQVKISTKKSDQTHIVMSFRSFDLFNKKSRELEVAAAILGGSMSSRLFKKMRDELGMCYYIKSRNFTATDYGYFTIWIGVGNDRAIEAVKVLLKECKKLRDEPISKKELDKAKNVVLGNFATELETSDSWSRYYGFQEIVHEKIDTPEEYTKKIQAVTADKIQKVLKEVIKNSGLNLALIGPQTDSAEFEKVLKV